MPQNIQSELILLAVCTLLGIIGYFLKKANNKIEATADSVFNLANSFNTKIDMLEEKLERQSKDTHTEILRIFQDMCHERQGACAMLRDAKLERVEVMAKSACNKIEKIESERVRQWERQDILNEKLKQHIYKTKNEGAAWELRDNEK